MNEKHSTVKMNDSTDRTINQRRSFIWKSGAAFSAVLASAVAGVGKAGATEANLQQRVEQLTDQLVTLEDSNAIRALHKRYGDHLAKGEYEEIVELFTDDGEVHFNGKVFSGKEQDVRQLYVGQFGGGISGEHQGPIHGMLREHAQRQDSIAIAPDRRSATASFHCLTQVAEAEDTNAPFLEMARLHGQGVRRWWEAGIYNNTYVRNGDAWKIKRLVYHPAGQADKEAVS